MQHETRREMVNISRRYGRLNIPYLSWHIYPSRPAFHTAARWRVRNGFRCAEKNVTVIKDDATSTYKTEQAATAVVMVDLVGSRKSCLEFHVSAVGVALFRLVSSWVSYYGIRFPQQGMVGLHHPRGNPSLSSLSRAISLFSSGYYLLLVHASIQAAFWCRRASVDSTGESPRTQTLV